MNGKMLLRVAKGAYNEFNEDKVLRLSGALAYYALFSLAPLVIIVISVAGIFFGTQAVTGQVQAPAGAADSNATTVAASKARRIGHPPFSHVPKRAVPDEPAPNVCSQATVGAAPAVVKRGYEVVTECRGRGRFGARPSGARPPLRRRGGACRPRRDP